MTDSEATTNASIGAGGQSWLGKAPIAPVILAIGALISIGVWLGMRSVEDSQAEVDLQRTLLAQSTELQGEIQRNVRGVDALALQAADRIPSPARLGQFIETFDMANSHVVVIERISGPAVARSLIDRESANEVFIGRYLAPSDPHFVITRASGFPDDSLVGLSFEGSEEFRALIASGEFAGGPVALTSAELPDGFAGVDGSSLVIASAYTNVDLVLDAGADVTESLAEGIDGVVVGQFVLANVVADMTTVDSPEDVALEIMVNGDPLAATIPMDDLEEPIGEPIEFTEQNATWAIQGFSNGLVNGRGASWLVLLLGLTLTALSALFAQTMRRHSLTLGRLERSEHDAKHDALTGLLNRSGLTDALTEVLSDRRGAALSGVLFLDLDRLKVVNDSIGHSAGDEVLSEVAKRLEKIVREDDIVGRFGGDEFVIVSSGVPAVSDLTSLADRVLDSLKEPAVLSDESSQMISASIGIAFAQRSEATAEDLLRDADLAMYRAKEAGGSRFEVFDDEMRSQAVARLEVERELRRAIRTGQLVVHYQPIVDISTGGVDRLEALVRWQHPVRGMVPPGAFLSVAAESGLIVDVGEHVLREACRQAALWSSAVGREVMVSVNVAERQLVDTSLVDTVKRVLGETGIKPSQLELEITEELIVDRLDHRLTVLHDLVAMGVQLAIDDFGTSRASLGQLKRLDMVNTLKIDRAFVIDVVEDVVDRKIITAIVALAESVGMEVVAEGVEDREQVAVLRQLGIDRIQGFYFQRPGPSETMVSLLNKRFDVPEAIDLGV